MNNFDIFSLYLCPSSIVCERMSSICLFPVYRILSYRVWVLTVNPSPDFTCNIQMWIHFRLVHFSSFFTSVLFRCSSLFSQDLHLFYSVLLSQNVFERNIIAKYWVSQTSRNPTNPFENENEKYNCSMHFGSISNLTANSMNMNTFELSVISVDCVYFWRYACYSLFKKKCFSNWNGCCTFL